MKIPRMGMAGGGKWDANESGRGGGALRRFGFALGIGLAITVAQAADPIAPQLRQRVEKARSQLGDLPPWQEEIFQNEVLASSGRFVRDYKTSAGIVTKADVDLEGIKRYLSFTATQILKPEANKVLLFVRANAACKDCGKAIAGIREDLKTRLERRGLVVILPTGDELRREPTEAYSKRNAAGWVLADVRAEEDADHPGDYRYTLVLDFRFPGTFASAVQKQMEILPSESVEVSMSRLAIDAVLEIGAKIRSGYASANVDAPGIDVAVDGVLDFPMLRQVKLRVQAALGADYRIVEKRIDRGGHAVLVAYPTNPGEPSAQPVAEAVRKSTFEGFSVQVTNVGAKEIALRIVPAARTGGA